MSARSSGAYYASYEEEDRLTYQALRKSSQLDSYNAWAKSQEAGASTDIRVLSRTEFAARSYFGLVPTAASLTSYTDFKYCFLTNLSDSTYQVFENGSAKTKFQVAQYGDILELRRDGSTGTVTYYINGILKYTSLATDTGAMRMARGTYYSGADHLQHKIEIDGVMAGAVWDTSANFTIQTTRYAGSITLQKDRGADWTGCAVSQEKVASSTDARAIYYPWNNGASAVHAEMVGLVGSGVLVDHYSDIEFAWYTNGTTLGVYESGTSKGTFGTYSAGDKLEVRRDGATGAVTYYSGGVLKYTSLSTSTAEMRVAVSIRDNTRSVAGAAIKDGTSGDSNVNWKDKINVVEHRDFAFRYTQYIAPSVSTSSTISRALGFAQSVVANITASPALSTIRSLLRTVTASLSVASTIETIRALIRAITAALSALASLITEQSVAPVEKSITANLSAAPSITTLVARLRTITASATVTSSLSTLRTLLRTITASSSVAASSLKRIGKGLSTALTATPSLAAATVTVTLQALSASLSTSASLIRQFPKTMKAAIARLNYPVYNTLYADTGPAWGMNASSSNEAPADTDITIYSEMSSDTYSVFGLLMTLTTDSEDTVDSPGTTDADYLDHTSWTEISYGLYAQDTNLIVYELGTSKGSFTVANGDTLSIIRTGSTGVIEYFKNGSLVYTSLSTDTRAAIVAGSLYRATTPNAIRKARVEIGDENITPVVWDYFDQSYQTAEMDTSVPGPSIATVRSLLRTMTLAIGLTGILTRVQGRLLTASVSVSASLLTVREAISRALVAGLSVTSGINKGTAKILTAPLVLTASLIRSITHGMVAILTIPSVIMIKRTILSIIATLTLTPTLAMIRALKLTLIPTITLTPIIGTVRSLLRTMTANLSVSAILSKLRASGYEQDLIAALSTSPVIGTVRALKRDILAGVTLTASSLKGHFLSLASGVTVTSSLLKLSAKNLTASISTLASIATVQAIIRTLTAGISTTATMARDFGLLLTAPLDVSATYKRAISLIRTVGITLTPSNLAEKLTNFLTLVAGITLNATIPSRLKGLGRDMVAGISTSTSFIRQISIRRTTGIDLSASFSRNIVKLLTVTMSATGTILKSLAHTMTTGLSTIATLFTIRNLQLSLTTALTVTAILLEEAKGSIYKGMLAARVTIGGALIGAVNTIEQGTLMATLAVKDSIAKASVSTTGALIRAAKKVIGK